MMKNKKIKIDFFYRDDNKAALVWVKKIKKHCTKKFHLVSFDKKPNILIVLGGDGTILEATRKYHESGVTILGFNLGHVGFLASARDEKDFPSAIDRVLNGKFSVTERIMISAKVKRNNKIIFSAEALNEVVVKSPLGMVYLDTMIENHPVKKIQGTGILVATATGSTAYNLSAHGPIVMPDIKCFIVTEVLDHSIPNPSIVVKYNNTIKIRVSSFRKRQMLSLSKTGQKFDVLLIADGESMFSLEEKDEVIITSSPHMAKFAELEKNYFFKSLQEKFNFE